jgi:hypothetical protein
MILTVDICGHRWTIRGSRDCDRAWAKSPSQLRLALIWALWRLGTLTCGDSRGATPCPLVREFHEHPTKQSQVVRLMRSCKHLVTDPLVTILSQLTRIAESGEVKRRLNRPWRALHNHCLT